MPLAILPFNAIRLSRKRQSTAGRFRASPIQTRMFHFSDPCSVNTGVLPHGSIEMHVSTLRFHRAGLRRITPPTMPSADFSAAIGALRPAQSGLPDTAEISRGKTDRLPRTPAGFTASTFDGRGLRDHLLARPGRPRYPVLGSCPSSRGFAPRFLQISRRLDAMLKAVKNVRAVLDDFYLSLGDEQKAQFNEIGRQRSAKE
jgi:LTXXQ motif family protein